MDWDETSVDEDARLVQIHRPDCIPDVVQQVKHGVLQLLAQYSAFGHAIPGIIEPTLEEYTHLGDAASKTDGRIYDPHLGKLESNGIFSGVPDDRWAFTTHTTPLNYGAAGALAAASRVLRRYDDALAQKCLDTAVSIWNDEQRHSPVIFESFNTTGGAVEEQEVLATVELLISTKGGAPYKNPHEGIAAHHPEQICPGRVDCWSQPSPTWMPDTRRRWPGHSPPSNRSLQPKWPKIRSACPSAWDTYIPGSMIPGVTVIQPDFPELKDR